MRRVLYVGHSTVELQLDGISLLTDPLLRRRVAHLRRAAPLELGELARPDAVLISHGHHDHLDLPSLRRLRPARVIAPRGLGGPLEGFEVTEVDVGDEVALGPVTVRATHAEHDGGRPPRVAGSALGYAVLGTRRVFFAGDTDLFDAMEGLVPDLDLALVPIWGWGASLGRGKHMDPQRAAEAVRRLSPKVAVPIHWGTYRPFHRGARATFLHAPPAAFQRAVELAAPGTTVKVLQPGAVLDDW
jgi:L-ascorbate metabolism protein UlaG (beta-lactamase superfamily)